MTTPQSSPARTWRTSTYSDTQQCVEVAQAGQACLVRDTKNRDTGTLSFSPRAWAAFTRAIKHDG